MCTGNIYGTKLECMEILLATNNKNKQKELVDIFFKHSSQHKLQFPNKKIEVIEDKLSIEENAQKKALEYFSEFNKPVISDDSGLFVNSLDGAPGVYSSRFAGEHASDIENNQKLIDLLLNSIERSAIFRTVLCFYDGKKILYTTIMRKRLIITVHQFDRLRRTSTRSSESVEAEPCTRSAANQRSC